jgi:hypothetical protein
MSALQAFQGLPTHSSFLLVVKVLFGIALIAGSPFLGVNLLAQFKEARASEAWPEAIAVIKESKVVSQNVGTKPGFSPRVVYSFEVEGRTCSGSQIGLASSDSRSRSGPENLVAKYAVGTQHPVYYEPGNPQNCVLEKGADWFHYLLLGVPFLLFSGGMGQRTGLVAAMEGA